MQMQSFPALGFAITWSYTAKIQRTHVSTCNPSSDVPGSCITTSYALVAEALPPGDFTAKELRPFDVGERRFTRKRGALDADDAKDDIVPRERTDIVNMHNSTNRRG